MSSLTRVSKGATDFVSEEEYLSTRYEPGVEYVTRAAAWRY
jgi:hypothetical protein